LLDVIWYENNREAEKKLANLKHFLTQIVDFLVAEGIDRKRARLYIARKLARKI
jgi:hypothetical protein